MVHPRRDPNREFLLYLDRYVVRAHRRAPQAKRDGKTGALSYG